jgi:hypothetical protein
MAQTCLSCEKRANCSVICSEIEALLPKISTGKLPRGEHSFDPRILENMANLRAFELKYGKEYARKARNEYENEVL